jgi:DNA-binding transcriptional regulator YhcF (GntR family)
MTIAQDSPLYSHVEAVLASEMSDGNLKVGDQLPTEDSLIKRFEVSRITVRRAIQNLVSRGLVEIRRGKGTFVAAPKITQELTKLSGFVEDMHAVGRKRAARVIGKDIVTADMAVASQLALTKGERVVRIRRVRLADGIPLSTAIREGRPEYDATVGTTARFQRDFNGKQPGDPVKAAAAVLHIVNLAEPPLRLILGSDAFRAIEKNDVAKLESDRKWCDLSLSTDFI